MSYTIKELDTVCKSQDAYVQDFYNCKQPVWVAFLSNGETIYQDDDRPNMYPQSAWLRLKNYCRFNDLKIVGLNIEFRSNKIEFERNAEGYFFSKAVGAWVGEESTLQYAIGVLSGDMVKIEYYQIPELCLRNSLERHKDKCEENLI